MTTACTMTTHDIVPAARALLHMVTFILQHEDIFGWTFKVVREFVLIQ